MYPKVVCLLPGLQLNNFCVSHIILAFCSCRISHSPWLHIPNKIWWKNEFWSFSLCHEPLGLW
jgi:hypothetical protein